MRVYEGLVWMQTIIDNRCPGDWHLSQTHRGIINTPFSFTKKYCAINQTIEGKKIKIEKHYYKFKE